MRAITKDWILFLVLFTVVSFSGCQVQKEGEKQLDISNEPKMATQLKCDKYKPVTWQSIWKARINQDHQCVIELADIFLSENPNENDQAVLYYLKADSLRQLQKYDESIILINSIFKNPDYSVAEFISEQQEKIKVKPLCEIGIKLAEAHDNSPFPESSEQYTTLAWKYFNKKQYDMAMFLSQRCTEIFKCRAKEQQRVFEEQNQRRPIVYKNNPSENKELHRQFWAVNDVGTCCFILGYSLEKTADEHRPDSISKCKYFQAIHCYSVVAREYTGAHCYDPKGPWYWQVKKAAMERRDKIELEKLGDVRQYRNECEAEIRSDRFFDLACPSSLLSTGNPQ